MYRYLAFTGITLVAAIIASLIPMPWGVIFFLAAVSGVLFQGFTRLPADPPTYGVLTFLGSRKNVVMKEGWYFFPLYNALFGIIPVDMTKKNFDLAPSGVRTPKDMARLESSVSLTFSPDPDNLIEYLNTGGENGVKAILSDMIEEAMRVFAGKEGEKPETWEEAVKMPDEFLVYVIKRILNEENEEVIREHCHSLRSGKSTVCLRSLGIILNKLNIVSLEPPEDLQNAAQKAAIEERERKADNIEIDNVADRVESLVNKGWDRKDAINVVQAERGKATRAVQDYNISGLDLSKIFGR